jgi:xanthine dehydrogenase accessory factor
MVDLFIEAARLGEAGEKAALATIIGTSGSVPRHVGAKMLVRADGSIVGTIGGGRIELEVTEAARKVAAGEPAQLLEKHLGHDLAMCCGGAMQVWIEPLGASCWKALDEVGRRRRRRLPSALVTQLGGAGGKDVLGDDESLRTRKARRAGDRFVEPVVPAERLVLFGGGHVAQATAPVAARVGFEVVVCDDDESFASLERFPGAVLVHSFDVRDVDRELAPFGPGDFAVVLTRDHAIDQEIVERLIGRADLTYLGLIGSQGKVGRFRKRIVAKGIVDERGFARLRAPVGLDIGAETPEEIAISIVGELVRERARARAGEKEETPWRTSGQQR